MIRPPSPMGRVAGPIGVPGGIVRAGRHGCTERDHWPAGYATRSRVADLRTNLRNKIRTLGAGKLTSGALDRASGTLRDLQEEITTAGPATPAGQKPMVVEVPPTRTKRARINRHLSPTVAVTTRDDGVGGAIPHFQSFCRERTYATGFLRLAALRPAALDGCTRRRGQPIEPVLSYADAVKRRLWHFHCSWTLDHWRNPMRCAVGESSRG